MRPHLAPDKYVVFHDGFHLEAWKGFFRDNGMENVALDTHRYLMMAELEGCGHHLPGYLDHIQTVWLPELREAHRCVPVLCGEWTIFNSCLAGVDTKGGQSVLNGVSAAAGRGKLSPAERARICQSLARAQLAAWDQVGGGYFWNYKVLLDTVHNPDWFGWDSWDLGKACAEGWFPVDGA